MSCFNNRSAPALVLALAAGCAPSLNAAEREAELIGRLVEAQGASEYTVTHPRERLNPLRGDTIDSIYEYQVAGERHVFALRCHQRYHSRRRGWIEAACSAQGLPPLDARAPSRFAAELVALAPSLAADFTCDEPGYARDFRLSRRSAESGAFVVMHACDRERTYHVRCETSDPTLAARRCRVEPGPITEPFVESAHPGARYVSCRERGWGAGVVEASEGELLDEKSGQAQFKDLAQALSVMGVRTFGFGLCCPTAERGLTWCVRAYVDPRAKRDVVVGLLADRLREWPGAKPRILVDTYSEIHEER